MKSFLGQIADDVTGYQGDSKYNVFYAVIYATSAFVGQEKFRSAWEERAFPPSWRGIYVVGSGKPKVKKTNKNLKSASAISHEAPPADSAV